MADTTTQQKRSGILALNRTQVGVALGFVAISVLLAFGAGFIVGMWYQATEHITPVASLPPAGGVVEPLTQRREMTFYSTLTHESPAKPTAPPASPPPRGATAPPPLPAASPPPPKTPERGTRQESPLPPSANVPPPNTVSPQPSVAGYSVQVGSFRAREDAERLRTRLVQKGYPVSIQPSLVAGQGIWYRVRVGNFPDRATADRTAQRLATQERVSVMVTGAPESR
jgi:cell division protein FtsN